LKFDNPNSAFTHTLNNLRYFINCGIVVLICCAVLLRKPNVKVILLAFIATLPINILLQLLLPEMNYFVRAFWVIICGLIIGFSGSKGKLHRLLELFQPANQMSRNFGLLLALSLLCLHFLFH
jgi:SSS family solute:Na+ symporter